MINKILNRLVSKGIIGNKLVNIFGTNYVKYDHGKSSFYQEQDGEVVYVQHPLHAIQSFQGSSMINWLCEEIYFKHYVPIEGDVYLDLGAGYGHEIVWLSKKSEALIHAVEANPIVYAYLCQNIKKVKGATPHNLFIGEGGEAYIPFSSDYAGLSIDAESVVKVRAQSFSNFLEINNIKEIDLLKINIEGGELPLLREIEKDLDKVKRIVVSCHDFRANRGDGEFFRTSDAVRRLLTGNGFKLLSLEPEIYPNSSWEKSVPFWIFATRSN